jgi:hypothetical protein
MVKEYLNSSDLIYKYQEEIVKIYYSQKLENLAGLDLDYNVNGRQILSWFFDVVTKKQQERPDFDFHKCFDDIILTCDEIMYFTANIHLYRPYISNPIENAFNFNGETVYPYDETIPDRRYNMFSNIVFEKLYNYWDRIGDVLAIYYPGSIDKKQVYFASTIDKFSSLGLRSDNFMWLLKFKESDYKDINSHRKEIVHYTSLSTQHKWTHIYSARSKEEVEKLFAEKTRLPEYFGQQLTNAREGFIKAIGLLEELN